MSQLSTPSWHGMQEVTGSTPVFSTKKALPIFSEGLFVFIKDAFWAWTQAKVMDIFGVPGKGVTVTYLGCNSFLPCLPSGPLRFFCSLSFCFLLLLLAHLVTNNVEVALLPQHNGCGNRRHQWPEDGPE